MRDTFKWLGEAKARLNVLRALAPAWVHKLRADLIVMACHRDNLF